MHIHKFYCRPPADYLTKQPPKLLPKLVSKKAKVDQATAVEGGHCFECECASLCSSSRTGVRWMALTKAEVGLSTSLGITVTRQATGKKKMGSCSPVLSKPDMKGPIYKRGSCIGGKQLIVKVIPDPRYFTGLSRHCFPLSSLSVRQRLDSGIAFTLHYTYDFFGQFHTLGLFDGTPCGAKQAHINLPFVWIFRYSCLWHGDSSWCAWAPQIS